MCKGPGVGGGYVGTGKFTVKMCVCLKDNTVPVPSTHGVTPSCLLTPAPWVLVPSSGLLCHLHLYAKLPATTIPTPCTHNLK